MYPCDMDMHMHMHTKFILSPKGHKYIHTYTGKHTLIHMQTCTHSHMQTCTHSHIHPFYFLIFVLFLNN